jgi:hypothetical protein
MIVLLVRTISNVSGTFGHLVQGDFHLVTCEPEAPRSGNKGRIPAGKYSVLWEPVGRFQGYTLKGVPGFENVEIHVGNDEDDTHGCILLGMRRGISEHNKEAVLDSRVALERFNSYMKQQPFTLEIIERFNA